VCTREAGAVFEAGGLNCVLTFIRDNGGVVHKDTLHSAMSVVSRLCSKMEPQDPTLPACVQSLSVLLRHEDSHVSCDYVGLHKKGFKIFLLMLTGEYPLHDIKRNKLYQYVVHRQTAKSRNTCMLFRWMLDAIDFVVLIY